MTDCTVFELIVAGKKEQISFERDYVTEFWLAAGDRVHVFPVDDTYTFLLGAAPYEDGMPCRVMNIVKAKVLLRPQDQELRLVSIVYLAFEAASTSFH